MFADYLMFICWARPKFIVVAVVVASVAIVAMSTGSFAKSGAKAEKVMFLDRQNIKGADTIVSVSQVEISESGCLMQLTIVVNNTFAYGADIPLKRGEEIASPNHKTGGTNLLKCSAE